MTPKLKFASAAAVPLLGLLFGGTPAAAGGCGYYDCGGEVMVQPQPYVAPSCGCGNSTNYYYGGGGYAPYYGGGYGGYAPGYGYQTGYLGGYGVYRGGFLGVGYGRGYGRGFIRAGYYGRYGRRW
jgi:hypothetical protein